MLFSQNVHEVATRIHGSDVSLAVQCMCVAISRNASASMCRRFIHWNAFLLFSRKKNNEMSWILSQVGFITYLLIIVKYESIYRHFTNVVHGL